MTGELRWREAERQRRIDIYCYSAGYAKRGMTAESRLKYRHRQAKSCDDSLDDCPALQKRERQTQRQIPYETHSVPCEGLKLVILKKGYISFCLCGG